MNAITVIVLIVIPNTGNNIIAPRKEIGTPAATHIASLNRRKTVNTINTRINPLRPFRD